MNDFFPTTNYEVPVTANYMKFQDGEYFNTDNKPVRSQELPEDTSDIKKGAAVKHFWAFPVWNYNAKRVQILEITQKGIMQTMTSYIKNPNWGNPKEYDFIVNRTGTGMANTEYATAVNPKSPLDEKVAEQYKNMNIDLTLLYVGEDPFNANK